MLHSSKSEFIKHKDEHLTIIFFFSHLFYDTIDSHFGLEGTVISNGKVETNHNDDGKKEKEESTDH